MVTTPHPGSIETPGHTFVTRAQGYPDPFAKLRIDTFATLSTLDAAAKARASIVRSCSEETGLSADKLEALQDLLRLITEQRKQLRAVRRMWQSLGDYERPSAALVEATGACLSDGHELAAALDPWRVRSLEQLTRTVPVTWERLAGAARRFALASVDPQVSTPSTAAVSTAV